MRFEKELKLVTRNTQEIVTINELTRLMKKKKKIRTYTGYETSGPIHIGHAIAVQKQIDFKNAGWHVIVLWPDIHTYLNKKGSVEWIEAMIKYWEACFKKLGLHAEFVRGSDFQLSKKYIDDLYRLSLKLPLSRARRSMDIIGRDMENPMLSQMLYPLMQALDIAHLKVDVAHGGMEQRKIHMLAREILPERGYSKPISIHSPVLFSLTGPGSKMSSSKPETYIAVHDSPEQIKQKMRKSHCIEKQTKFNFPLDVAKFFLFPRTGVLPVERNEQFGGDVSYTTYEELEKDFVSGKLHPLDLKNAIAKALIKELKPCRDLSKRKTLMKPLIDKGFVK